MRWGSPAAGKGGSPPPPACCSSWLGGQAFAKTDIPETRNPFIPAVASAYESLELEAALSALGKASAWPDNGPRERLWLALMEGVLQFGAGDEARALAAFGRALAIDPEAQLPVQASPRLRGHFARARAALGPPAPKPPPPETSPPPSPVPVPLGVPVSVPASPPARPEPPKPEPPVPAPARQPLEWSVGLRGEAEVLGRALVPALTGELSRGHLGAAATVLLKPSPGLRLEGRYYLLEQPVRPYVALGATTFFPAVGARAAAGMQVRLGPSFTLSAEAAYERFLNPGDTYSPNALLFSLGAGWRFPGKHRR